MAEEQNPPPKTPDMISNRTVPYGSSSSTATRRNSLETSSRKTGPAMFSKLDRKKLNDQKLDTTEVHIRQRSMKPETKRVLFGEISDEKMHGSQYHEHESSSGVAGSNDGSNLKSVQQDFEDLSLIRNQLVQIETQQSNLFDLLEKFIGSSVNGMQSLESRVLGVESTLSEISFDLAKSTEPTSCCKLPGADLLSSKLWKKSEILHSNMRRFSSPPIFAKNMDLEPCNLETTRLHLHGGRAGFIKNPLAETANQM